MLFAAEAGSGEGRGSRRALPPLPPPLATGFLIQFRSVPSQPFHTLDGHLDEEERRFKDALDKQVREHREPRAREATSSLTLPLVAQANIDDLFDFDQDDVEFDERELEQVREVCAVPGARRRVPRPRACPCARVPMRVRSLTLTPS